jgi:uncharacterized protein (TIGR03435 family)
MVAAKVTMTGLASCLNLVTGRKVVDETGLHGYYDFDVTWNDPASPRNLTPGRQFGDPELIGLLISNLQAQFGLRLASAIGPADYWIVDHVQQPPAN